MKAICLMILALFAAATASAFAGENLKFHRWNEGYKAESETAFEMEVSDAEFTKLMASPDEALNKNSTSLYAGCYAVEKTPARGLASAEENKPKFYKICLH